MSLGQEVIESEELITLRETYEKLQEWMKIDFVQQDSALIQAFDRMLHIIGAFDSIKDFTVRMDHLDQLIDSMEESLILLTKHDFHKEPECITMMQCVMKTSTQYQMSRAVIRAVWKHLDFLGVY